MTNDRVFAMKFAKVYPLYVQKAEKKNRTKEEVDQVICWLTGYDEKGLHEQIKRETDFTTFFAEAPRMHPNSRLIKGVVCGVRVEEIEDALMPHHEPSDISTRSRVEGVILRALKAAGLIKR